MRLINWAHNHLPDFVVNRSLPEFVVSGLYALGRCLDCLWHRRTGNLYCEHCSKDPGGRNKKLAEWQAKQGGE